MPRHYDDSPGDPNLGDESARDLGILSDHVTRWWGDGLVFHEIVSEYVHLDVHISRATASRPYHVLVTTGMSDRPMKTPEGSEDCRHAELMLALPPEWPLSEDDVEDEKNWWPLRHLKQTARFPHIVETWLWHHHTVGNGESLDPVHPSAPFVGFALGTPRLCPDEARSLRIRTGKEVHFFSLIPLYEAELKFAWKHGTVELFKRLDAAGVTELVQPGRPSVVSVPLRERLRRFWPTRK